MRLPATLLALALLPAAGALAQEPQPTPAPQEQPAPAQEPVVAAAPAGDAQTHIDAGLAAFRKRRFAAARQHFEQAVAADPGSAAANFYLGYTIYKIAEPKRPFHPDKQKAAELFAKAYELDPQFKPVWSRKHS
jgi:tetratricopeptide (TPR) repeat protein